MVKKLLRNEMAFYFRTAVLMYPILFGIALLTRIVQFFESDTVVFSVFSSSSIFAMVVGCVAVLLLTVILIVVRFYRNLYGREGYLSFTLPVTENQHILSKLAAALIFTFASALSVLIAVCIATAGDLLNELLKVFFYLTGRFFDRLGVHAFFDLLLMILDLIALFSVYYLFMYFCITLGQRAKKHRVLLAVALYYGIYYAGQVILTVFLAVFTLFADRIPWEQVFLWIGDNSAAFLYIFLLAVFLVCALFSLLFWCVSRGVMKKKLNLE